MPWVFSSSFCSIAGDEGFRPKSDFSKMRKDSRVLEILPPGLSHRNPGD
jgi:hypothetical protein